MHIGIVAVSAEGAALCYRTICKEAAERFGKHGHPEITVHTYSLAEYMRHIERGRWDEVPPAAARLRRRGRSRRCSGSGLSGQYRPPGDRPRAHAGTGALAPYRRRSGNSRCGPKPPMPGNTRYAVSDGRTRLPSKAGGAKYSVSSYLTRPSGNESTGSFSTSWSRANSRTSLGVIFRR